MISIVLYGRNDNYGYNLHKRAALSFNCMAEVLEGEEDEILFVDYNTPDDFPTFPEAIQDTLSQKARQRLRIFRVRPHVHRRFSARTKLVALEPIARNVAVRRSNPANRWILSTNTDMIFVPQRKASLNEIARDLPSGFYHAPRLEIPETLWEGLDRAKGREAIETVRDWGSSLHINEIVLGAPTILYDAPGDFQLMQRADLFQIGAFHEAMLLGWHVDSNIAKRLTFLHGKVGDLGKEVFGYHCDHTRQVTPVHSHSRTENDWRRFIEAVERPDIPEQARDWGCAGDEIEEIRLTNESASAYIRALKGQIGERQSAPPVVAYVGENYNETDYDPRHVLPYLADMFVRCEKRTNLGWFGTRRDTLARFSGFWKDLGFTGDILVDQSLVREANLATAPQAIETNLDAILSKADAFVFDFGPTSKHGDAIAGVPRLTAHAMNRVFLRVVMAEHRAMREGQPPRRVIGLNTINNLFESFMIAHIGAAHTPFSGRMRNGFVLAPIKGEVDWTPRMQVGDAGMRDGLLIRSRDDLPGVVMYGPYWPLYFGTYRFRLRLTGNTPSDVHLATAVAVLEIISQRSYLGHRLITLSDLAKGEIEIETDVTAEQSVSPGFSIQTPLRTLMPIDIAISGLSCERISDKEILEPSQGRALLVNEWLPLLWTGSEGERKMGKIVHRSGKPGFVFYGPYWTLPKGSYVASFALEFGSATFIALALKAAYRKATNAVLKVLKFFWRRLRGKRGQASAPLPSNPLCLFEAVSQETQLAARLLFDSGLYQERRFKLAFRVTPSQSADPNFALELRLFAHEKLPFAIKSVTVGRLKD